MNRITLGNPSTDGRDKVLLQFDFDSTWTIVAFDEASNAKPFANPDYGRFQQWAFRECWKESGSRRKSFSPRSSGRQAVDIVAHQPDDGPGTVWMIEVTDYRTATADELPPPDQLAHEFSGKVRDSLAALALGRAMPHGACGHFTKRLGDGAAVQFVLYFRWPTQDPLAGLDQALDVRDMVLRALKSMPVAPRVYVEATGQPWQVTEVGSRV